MKAFQLRKYRTFALVVLTTFLCVFLTKSYSQHHKVHILELSTEKHEELSEKKLLPRNTFPDSISALRTAESLKAKLIGMGYISVYIDKKTAKDTCTYIINSGKQYKWKQLTTRNIEPNWLDYAGLKKANLEQEVFSFKGFTGRINRLLNYAENNGYPFAQISVVEAMIENNEISAVLELNKGDLIVIDSLVLNKEAKISHSFLRNYLGIKSGDRYSEQKIRRISKRLSELTFLEQTNPPYIIFVPGSADIHLGIRNKKASRFDGIIGVMPDPAKEGKVNVGGEFSVLLHNSFGRAEKLGFQWRKLQASSQQLDVVLNYPCILNSAFGIDFQLNLLKHDTLYINVDRKIGVQYLFGGNTFIEGYARLKQSDIISTDALKYAQTLPEYADISNQSYGLRLNVEKLDYRLNPSKGYHFYINADAGMKKIKINPSLPEVLYDGMELQSAQYQVNAEGSYFFNIWKNYVIKPHFSTGYLLGENLFANELFRLGGFKRLRGHDEDAFLVSAYALTSLEIRLILEKNSVLFAFADYAYTESRIKDKENEFIRPWGIGMGMNFETRAGIFSFAYGLGATENRPLDLRSGKVHVGFLNFF